MQVLVLLSKLTEIAGSPRDLVLVLFHPRLQLSQLFSCHLILLQHRLHRGVCHGGIHWVQHRSCIAIGLSLNLSGPETVESIRAELLRNASCRCSSFTLLGIIHCI